MGKDTGHSLVQEILTAAGKPVAGHTLSVQEMEQAVKEGRVLQVDYWSHFGDGEASFSFANSFGLDGDGRVHPCYMVFPHSIPASLRVESPLQWEKANEVFAAFAIDQS